MRVSPLPAPCSSSAVMKHLHPLGGPSNSPSRHTRKRSDPLRRRTTLPVVVLVSSISHLPPVNRPTSVCCFHGKLTDWVQASCHSPNPKKDEVGNNYTSFLFSSLLKIDTSVCMAGWRLEGATDEKRVREQRKKTCWQSFAIHKPLVPPTVCS